MQEDTTKPTAGDFDADFVTTVGDMEVIADHRARRGDHGGAGDAWKRSAELHGQLLKDHNLGPSATRSSGH